MNQIVFYDQIGARKPIRNLAIDWRDGVPLTLRELITERVKLEYERINDPLPQLAPNELIYLPSNIAFKTISVDHAIAQALQSFSRRGFVVIIGGKQIEALDDVILLSPQTQVTFIKLMPLKGG